VLLVVVDGMLEDGGGGGVPPLTPASGRSLDADGGGVLVLAYRLLVLQVICHPTRPCLPRSPGSLPPRHSGTPPLYRRSRRIPE